MQSYLPDINTKYITYARVVLSSLASKKWASCFGALNSENALLPKEFQVEISTAKYNDKTKQNTVAVCNKCEQEIKFETIKILHILSPMLIGVMNDSKTEKIWNCPNCKSENKLKSTKLIKSKLAEPFFLRVVPNPPIRKDGLLDRNTYDRKAEQWVWNFQNELDNAMAEFRAANWNKEDADNISDTEYGKLEETG